MLSQREQDTYDFIRNYIAKHGRGPLLTEIAEGLGIRSRGVVHRYVQALAQAGVIELIQGRHRGIQLPAEALEPEYDPEAHAPVLPILGKIAAGLPIEAIPDQQEINLADFFLGPNRYVLRVQGESMIDAGIMPDDMVVIESCNQARNGEIVVALVDRQEATLKRLKNNHDGTVTLIPENSTMKPMTFAADRVQIQGVVVSQMRSYK
jgi:repressor LexA